MLFNIKTRKSLFSFHALLRIENPAEVPHEVLMIIKLSEIFLCIYFQLYIYILCSLDKSPSLLSNENRGRFPLDKSGQALKVNHSPPSSPNVKDVRALTSTNVLTALCLINQAQV